MRVMMMMGVATGGNGEGWKEGWKTRKQANYCNLMRKPRSVANLFIDGYSIASEVWRFYYEPRTVYKRCVKYMGDV